MSEGKGTQTQGLWAGVTLSQRREVQRGTQRKSHLTLSTCSPKNQLGTTAIKISLTSSVLVAMTFTKPTYLILQIPYSLNKCGHLHPARDWSGGSAGNRTSEPC